MWWQNEGGWNLVELNVTLLLITLLAGLAYPAFAGWAERVERELFLGTLAADIRMAQREAMAMEQEVSLTFDAQNGSYHILRGSERIRQGRIPARLQVESNYPSDQILFRRTGQTRGGTLLVRSQREVVGKIVIQVASGRPRVEVAP
ncbi:GspH/FimT family pseudopilin [Desmospora activa]|nr:GspH/FimT family pseudopilin [Desmospora activa]